MGSGRAPAASVSTATASSDAILAKRAFGALLLGAFGTVWLLLWAYRRFSHRVIPTALVAVLGGCLAGWAYGIVILVVGNLARVFRSSSRYATGSALMLVAVVYPLVARQGPLDPVGCLMAGPDSTPHFPTRPIIRRALRSEIRARAERKEDGRRSRCRSSRRASPGAIPCAEPGSIGQEAGNTFTPDI
jgi:hypothetical protein